MAVTGAAIDRLRKAVERLPYGLAEHVLRVEGEALALAEAHDLNSDRVRAAVLGHDLLRAEAPERLLQMAEELGLPIEDADRVEPMLLHGPVAARLLQADYGVSDTEVLSAVAVHTVARAGMGEIEKVLFLADKVEEHKLARRPELAEVRALAFRDLDSALLRFLDLYLTEAVQRGWLLHRGTIESRNEMLLAGIQGQPHGG